MIYADAAHLHMMLRAGKGNTRSFYRQRYSVRDSSGNPFAFGDVAFGQQLFRQKIAADSPARRERQKKLSGHFQTGYELFQYFIGRNTFHFPLGRQRNTMA